MKITVAIPTTEGRSRYLESCLRTCVAQDDDNLEILVSDNSSHLEARPVVSSFNERRIRYVHPPSYLTMSAHWDFVLSQVSGDVFTIIGDDDGLMPGCIRAVRHLRSEVGDIPIHHSLCNYRWPDHIDVKTRNHVEFHHAAGWRSRMVESSDYLAGVARATERYLDGPMVYHNFVPTSLVRGLMRNGLFFRRASPDVYSAIAVAANTPRFFSTEEVLTISGQGARANGASVQAGRGAVFLREADALYTPRFGLRAVQMALLDSLTEVALHFNRPDLLSGVRYADHIVATIGETRAMAKGARMPEIREALRLAKRHSVTMGVITGLVGAVIEKGISSNSKPRRASNQAFGQGAVVQLPSSVRNIFEASYAVADLLAEARYGARRSDAACAA